MALSRLPDQSGTRELVSFCVIEDGWHILAPPPKKGLEDYTPQTEYHLVMTFTVCHGKIHHF